VCTTVHTVIHKAIQCNY